MKKNQGIIRLEKVSKAFDSQKVLNEVDLEIRQSQTTVVIGPSGCGKSVLLKHIVGLLKPDPGRVFFKDQEVTYLSERKLRELETFGHHVVDA